MPFYFHTGLVYKGSDYSHTRSANQLGVVFGYGNYSYYKILGGKRAGASRHTRLMKQSSNSIIAFSGAVPVQAALSSVSHPPKRDRLGRNATVLGLQVGVVF